MCQVFQIDIFYVCLDFFESRITGIPRRILSESRITRRILSESRNTRIREVLGNQWNRGWMWCSGILYTFRLRIRNQNHCEIGCTFSEISQTIVGEKVVISGKSLDTHALESY